MMKSFMLLVLLIPLVILNARCEMNEQKPDQKGNRVRKAVFAGSWYEGTEAGLEKQVDGFLRGAKNFVLDEKETVRGLICPHAGLVYSGSVAAAGYKTLIESTVKRVIILAVCHHYPLRDASIADVSAYSTPLGTILLDRKACDKILSNDLFGCVPAAHRSEHSLEIQLPFLQRVLKGGFLLIPILVGQASLEECAEMAEALLPYWDPETLVVASSDFTHYGRNYGYAPFEDKIPENLFKLDHNAIDRIEAVDPEGFLHYVEKTGATICGRMPITVLLEMAKKKGYSAREIDYQRSGDLTGDWSASVSYTAVAILGEKKEKEGKDASEAGGKKLTKEEKVTLLRLARKTLQTYLETGKEPSDLSDFEITPNLRANQGAFVTLKIEGRLRGCIGYLRGRGPLYKAVIENTINAAVHDPRFPPVRCEEEPKIHIEISVLSPLVRVKNIEEILPGRDGLIVTRGFARGTLLPQVATEYGWNRTQFLENTCLKAGLPRDAWKDPDTIIERYEAQYFDEPGE